MTARYLYEHLYLAHIYFKTAPNQFFELVRSYTPSPKPIERIVTLRPFDDPKTKKFYYRFRKIHSTIVHKTHMVFKFDDAKLDRFNQLFIEPKWAQEPHLISYDVKLSTNPFLAFSQIPVRSRYQFLLDNSHYVIMTFIRGPVCRGQMALNVIHDHFWVMFKDPDYDIGVLNPKLLIDQADNLELPIQSVDGTILKVFSDSYRERYTKYYKAKERYLNKKFPDGQALESIWRGDKPEDAPILTVYRHFNSASVHKGVLGEEPRTMWVIDYPQFERIYYILVAGYDVFGNITHQTNIRRYTDFLRIEGESNFLTYLPIKKRLPLWKSWYIGDKEMQDKKLLIINGRGTKVEYKTDSYKNEFVEQVVHNRIYKQIGIDFDKINYIPIGESPPKMPTKFKTLDDYIDGFRSLSENGTKFIQHVTDHGLNNIFIRLKLKNNRYKPIYMVINRWHDNVNSLFNEEKRVDPKKDSIDFLSINAGSYPNLYVDIDYKDLPDFFDLMKNYDASKKYKLKIKKYFVSRSDKDFWEINDWFQNYLNKTEPIEAGLYDLNRYYDLAW
jgi:hypothetical protein